MPGCLPSVPRRSVPLLGVHPTRSAVRGPGVQPSGVQPSGVQPSGVQPVQCPVIWLPRPGAAVQPAGVQPVRRPAAWCPPVQCLSVRCLSVRSQPSRPAAAGWWRWGTPRYGGAAVAAGSDRVEFHVVRPRPAARSAARAGMDTSTAAEVVWRPAGERQPRTWPGGLRWEAAPTDQAGQAAARTRPVAGDGARQGSWLRACFRASAGSCWSPCSRACRSWCLVPAVARGEA
jgi:hypothetical protein